MLFFLPLGTRYIFLPGNIAGADVEWGTVSLFVTQLLAAAFVAAVFAVRVREISWAKSWPAAVLSAAILMSVMRADDLLRAFATNGWWLFLGLLVWCAVRLLRPASRGVLVALSASAALQSLLAALQFGFQEVWGSRWLGVSPQSALIAGTSVVEAADGRWLRAYGTLPHPNVLGIYCAVGLTMALWLVLRGKGQRLRRLAAVSLPVITLGLVLSFSRSAWLGAAFGLTAVLVSSLRRSSPKRKTVAVAALAVMVSTVVGAVAVLPGPFLSRVTATGRLESASISERISSVEDAKVLLARRPFFGVGPGQMPYATANQQPDRSGWSYQPVHLLPVIIGVEVGLVGLAAWALWLLWPCSAAFLRSRRCRWLPGPGSVGLIVMLVAGLFDHYAWTLWPGAVLFFILAGLEASASDRCGKVAREHK